MTELIIKHGALRALYNINLFFKVAPEQDVFIKK